jgi:hypothetical protein
MASHVLEMMLGFISSVAVYSVMSLPEVEQGTTVAM